MNTDVLVVGAGLSGLYAAHLLKKQNIQTTVVEARSRPGGRVLSELPIADIPAGVDMGPSWFWPWQSRMLSLISEMGLDSRVYEQHSLGAAIAEYRTGKLVQQQGTASMAGSLRLSGGLQSLVHSLTDSISLEHIHSDKRVVHVEQNSRGILATTEHFGIKKTINARRIVLAAPPRVLASSISYSPALETSERRLMENTPTWMAGQAKFVAVYDTPFWRKKGLSGDGISEIGPLGEIHDASAIVGPPYALFGFVGLPATARVNRDEEVIQAATEQLLRMFGSGQEKPTHVFYKDWASDDLTATNADRNGPGSHVHQTVSTIALWENRLYWAGSETAAVSTGDNGYLEGALVAAERVVKQILETHNT
ncbi:MAG: monoamine oxidase [Granulosicoccus sp.]|jgi:monoamine oxidase